jgi:hypothetical protein
MDRRLFLGTVTTAMLTSGGAANLWAQLGQTMQQGSGSGFPGGQSTRGGNNTGMPQQGEDEEPTPLAPHAMRNMLLLHNQQQIQKDVIRLYGLVDQLRKQVSDTDSTQVLSLDLIRTLDEVEKLTRQIRNLAKD